MFAWKAVLLVLHVSLAKENIKQVPTMDYQITTEWNGNPIHHPSVKISLSWKEKDSFLTAIFDGPFFDDPPAPNGAPGKPFPKLWDYEVAEIFFLSPSNQYLEVEVSPHGQHLLLLLNGTRNMIEDELPMKYTSSINQQTKTWTGRAEIPLSYLPRGVNKMNAYAIHGSDANRTYEALYPVPSSKFTQPDFHRLDYFQNFDITTVVKDTSTIGTYWDNL